MKELNYQYKIIEEKNINGKNILKIKDDIYDKIIFMEIYKTTDSGDWDKSNEAEQEIGKLKDSGEISDYFVNDDYSSEIKTFYKIYEDYEGFEGDTSGAMVITDVAMQDRNLDENIKEDVSAIGFDDNLSDAVFKNDDDYELGDLSDSIGSGYEENKQEFESFSSNSDTSVAKIKNFDTMGNVIQSNDIRKVKIVVNNAVVQESEIKLNSYTSKNNQAEIERIKKLSNQPRKTNYNTYSNSGYSVSGNKTKKSSKGGGLIFFIIVVGVVGATFYTNRAKRHHYNYSSSYSSTTNYERGANYYQKGLYYSSKKYFKKSCNYDKDKRGCSMLGHIYENGEVYKKNKYKYAVEYYVKGCELNDSYSCERAGLLSRVNLKENKYALRYDVLGCDLNSGLACTEAGYVYEVIKKDNKTAKKFYENGCKFKNKVGCYNLALIYHYDKIKGIKNIDKAKKLYKKACDLGYKKGCNIKFGADTNNKKDIEISDDPQKLFELAWKYQNKKDYFNANLLFSKACTKGHVKSCNNLGYNYEKGNGYSKSTLMAKKYFLQGCGKKSGYACNKIGYFYEIGTEFKKNLKQARAYYKKGCNLKYGLACNNLAKIFEYGKGIKKDMASAKFLYKKACKLGYKKACK